MRRTLLPVLKQKHAVMIRRLNQARDRVQVALKIIKHCKDSVPQLVTGLLLGLDIGSTLEVTNCFPFPVRSPQPPPPLSNTPSPS